MSDIGNTLEQALEILSKEMKKLQSKSKLKKALDRQDASNLSDYVKIMLMVRKDERESTKQDNLASIPTDELTKLAEEALQYLNKKEG